jgi:hypothetical protein
VKTRRGFLRTILAAPVAAVVAVGLWPEAAWARYQRLGVLKYRRYVGTMEITPEAMEKIWWIGGGGGGKTAMQRELNRQMSQTLEQHREEMDRIYGHHTAARGDEIIVASGEVGGAGAYPSEVTGA